MLKRLTYIDEVWQKAKDGDISILNNEKLLSLKSGTDSTPLHWLAENIVRNNSKNVLKVLKHPMIDKIKNCRGETPLDWFYITYKMKKQEIKKEWLKFLIKILRVKK